MFSPWKKNFKWQTDYYGGLGTQIDHPGRDHLEWENKEGWGENKQSRQRASRPHKFYGKIFVPILVNPIRPDPEFRRSLSALFMSYEAETC